ncbi:RISC-loading complex subunit tarbp2-like [Diorhabda carinulata]|uniref:RISC-loading complex subunit tarbp2-like n=1 Tax=Diorhabda carinulata TaxID=1163345 RepID=UPI0025A2332E|nr:RISC-loading complex subunit tarbp2-like [Diorhabda carinulata]
MSKLAKNPAMVLQELTVKKCLGPPNFEIVHSISGTHENRFDYRVRVAGVEAIGTGSSKQISKHDAAYKALKMLEEIGIYDPVELPMEEFKASAMQKQAGYRIGSPNKLSINCIGPLKDLCMENKIEDPVFTEISDVGPPHCREFTYECCIGSVKTIATANTKKMAKQLTAKEMLERLKYILPTIKLEAPRKTEEQKTLMPSEIDLAALQKYNEVFSDIVPDKKVKVDDFASVFNRLMLEYKKTREDFNEEFTEISPDSLERMLKKLGLQYVIFPLQEQEPIILALRINCDVPFATMAVGRTEELAKSEVINNTFKMLDCFIK